MEKPTKTFKEILKDYEEYGLSNELFEDYVKRTQDDSCIKAYCN